MGMKNANSTEMDPDTESPVVIDMPEHNTGKMGGTMRLGRRATIFRSEGKSTLSKLYIFYNDFFAPIHHSVETSNK